MHRLLMFLLFLLVIMATTLSAATLPPNRSLHEMCSQNLVCADSLYCRRYNGAEYGTCEIPT
ncbi:uncharacterized protein BX664DRAFT_359033 [Halteromyces radiatus]|uniref:uncharacterized protein n=1 Tax=Halteromyces radiatus TaxID=101107 RepID=UPI00221FC249|nr:uncharacterized protein BX664DRAFT_359033 [Halteromyces radiatus]KAI8089484.1 hypothetical protein BX664DRAFT_359033 [Halteromyces radiatus]